MLARYRQLREISKQHHSAVLKFLSGDAIMSQARDWVWLRERRSSRTAWTGRRNLQLRPCDPHSIEGPLASNRPLCRERRGWHRRLTSHLFWKPCAARASRSSVLCAGTLLAGLIVKDVFRDDDIWLVDEGLETSFVEGMGLATRLFAPERFAMTAGVMVPLDRKSIAAALTDTPLLLRKNYQETGDDRRFAEAIYRVALAKGLTNRCSLQRTLLPNLTDVLWVCALQHHVRAIWRSIFTRSRQYARTRGQGARLRMKTGPRDKKVAMLIAGESSTS